MTATDGVYQFSLGAFNCTSICDGEETWETVPEAWITFANASRAEVAEARRAYTAATGDPSAEVSMNILLIDTGAQKVLVDTGCGPHPANPANGKLLGRLASIGISPADIDIVINTHGHWDHIEGNTDGHGNPTFPNARYVMSEVEWVRQTTDPAENAKTHLLAIADRFERIAMDAEIVPGIRALPAPGHSPGQIALLIESDGAGLLQAADTFHHPVELMHPEWYFAFESDPEATVRTRRDLCALAAREQLLVLPYHLPFPGLGRITTNGDHWLWQRLIL
jgi:glyoxylase-like metal-dependent hydrolase (beta-lactamase superfamily II)